MWIIWRFFLNPSLARWQFVGLQFQPFIWLFNEPGHRNPGLTSAAGPSSESSCEWNFPQLGSFISCLLILRALRVSRLLWPDSWLLAPSSSLLAPSRRLPPDTRSGRRTRRRSITIPDCTAASPAIASTPELWTELNPAQFRENLQGKTRAG